MPDWLQRILKLAPQQQLVEIEVREPSLEDRLQRIVARLGNYKNRSPMDLEELIDDLDKVMNVLENIISVLENVRGAERAKNLRFRLRINRTRAEKALDGLKKAS
jgi:molecular chaperone GrpE (heat shock protein)